MPQYGAAVDARIMPAPAGAAAATRPQAVTAIATSTFLSFIVPSLSESPRRVGGDNYAQWAGCATVAPPARNRRVTAGGRRTSEVRADRVASDGAAADKPG
ncbi:hypothetical protein Pme01_42250 [Planosporangium mesophilum]|uniref:Uncharacterized protein n=1 Tax=Planosporangium mesophilum TaxID=689768 RepID=A0A8J3TDV2_9ACTN|nr:hypothetical protein Pme01_42250 [Planosporangium mesophilum]